MGGGLQVAYGATANLYGGKISGNKAYNGGGVLVTGKDAVLNLLGAEITGNTANNGGGALSQNGAAINMSAGKICNNQATANGGGLYVSSKTTFNMSGGEIFGNRGIFGGGVYTLSAVSTFSGGSIYSNYAAKGGGGAYISMVASVGPSTAYIKGSAWIGANTAGTTGGGIGVSGRGTKLYMTGGMITGNKGQNGGGVIVFTDSVLELSGGTISENKSSAAGGGAYISIGGDIRMTGGSIEGNHAGTNGGAVQHYRSTGTYTGGNIRGNTCDGNAAMFMLTGAAANIYVKGFEFTGGNGKNGSVACNTGGSTVNFEDCKFYGNVTNSGHGTIYVSSNSFGSFKNCKFYNNEATFDGGAVFGGPNCTIDLADCIFTENISGRNGGAILCRGTMTFENCDISNNQAAEKGGGIATGKCGIKGSKFQEGLVLKNTTVANNTAADQGGGLYLSIGCRAAMSDTVVSGNHSGKEGSGFWAVDDTTLHNVTITGNVSQNNGYAAWYDASVYDGQSYFVGVHKLSGDIVVTDNQGGDMYLGNKTTLSIAKAGLGENTEFGITLDEGFLTSRLHGAYDYEGGNLVYMVSCGDRSMRELENVQETATGDNSPIYVGIVGIAAVVMIAAAVLVIVKKKKTNKAESK